MSEQEVRKAKRFNYTVFTVLCVCILAFIGWTFWVCNRPIDPDLKPEQLEQAVDGSYLALVGDTCYELATADGLADLCQFDSWKQIDRPEKGDYVLTLRMGEAYELAFFENGIAEAFNGYSRKHHVSTAWYRVPEDVGDAVAEYIRENGILRQPLLGSGSWFIINE